MSKVVTLLTEISEGLRGVAERRAHDPACLDELAALHRRYITVSTMILMDGREALANGAPGPVNEDNVLDLYKLINDYNAFRRKFKI